MKLHYDYLKESEAVDVASADLRIGGDVFYTDNPKAWYEIDVSDTSDEDLTDEELDNIGDITEYEFKEVLDTIKSPDDQNLILNILCDEGFSEYCDSFDDLYNITEYDPNFYDIAYTILAILNEIMTFSEHDFTDLDTANAEIDESIVNKAHIRKLRIVKKTAAWQRAAKVRAKWRKTASGQVFKRKAKRMMKKYRNEHSSKLKAYGKSYISQGMNKK